MVLLKRVTILILCSRVAFCFALRDFSFQLWALHVILSSIRVSWKLSILSEVSEGFGKEHCVPTIYLTEPSWSSLALQGVVRIEIEFFFNDPNQVKTFCLLKEHYALHSACFHFKKIGIKLCFHALKLFLGCSLRINRG